LYDLSELAIPTDNVDREYIQKPKRLDASYVRNFMVYFGPVSSIFDFLTFFIMLYVFNAWNNGSLFQTAWFIESLCTQTLVIFSIRTRRWPFFRSRPSKLLMISSLSVVAFAILVPFTPIGSWFQFIVPPITFFVFLAAFVVAYLTMVESLKRFFYKHYADRLEQIIVPHKLSLYPTPMSRLIQNMIAIICLRFESEISIDSLVHDLGRSVNYPVDSEQVVTGLHHLRRSGLVEIDWRRGTVKRQEAIKDYVVKYASAQNWPRIAEDWRRIDSVIQTEYHKKNPDYDKLIS
jgi:hypothetical protein